MVGGFSLGAGMGSVVVVVVESVGEGLGFGKYHEFVDVCIVTSVQHE